MKKRVGVAVSEVFLRRLAPSLAPFVRSKLEFCILGLHRGWDNLLQMIPRLQLSGLITEWLPESIEAFLPLGYPTVIAASDQTYPNAISIDVDDVAVGREAAAAFLRYGYRHFACVVNLTPYGRQRLEGFIGQLQLAGRTCRVWQEEEPSDIYYMETWKDTHPQLLAWLQDLPRPIGIFAVHDPLGRLLCDAAQVLHLQVPEEIAVIGANNDELLCNLTFPTLSSVQIPWDKIGFAVGTAMWELLSGRSPPAEPILIQPGPVVARESSDRIATQVPLLRRTLGYLQMHCRERITIGKMCAELRISRRQVERLFTEHLGRTPKEMLCEMRVNLAKELLVSTTLPLYQIAELSGFAEPSQFSRVFRRITGQCPSAYH